MKKYLNLEIKTKKPFEDIPLTSPTIKCSEVPLKKFLDEVSLKSPTHKRAELPLKTPTKGKIRGFFLPKEKKTMQTLSVPTDHLINWDSWDEPSTSAQST